MRRLSHNLTLALLVLIAAPRSAAAYSVLAHEAMVDARWDEQIAPLLTLKFARATAAELRAARAYAYGGSLIQDFGYYPFGSRFFSNVVHYVRSGDFVEALVRESRDVNEYAFALGALAHYASDSVGHPIGVNRVVPIVYPKLAREHGPEVLYADSPARHVMVEFSFDVLQIARGTFKSDVYQDLVGFEVAVPVLARAFRATYSLELTDVFGDVDLAIGSYRKAASDIIPQITRVAWEQNRDEIVAANPTVAEKDFVYTLTRQQYEERFGNTYRKPGLFARFVVMLFKIVPKFGPFKPLAFEPLTPATEKMFLDSFDRARARYRGWLTEVRDGRLTLGDADLDTGRQPVLGANPLADETFSDLLERLEKIQFAGTSGALRAAINEHYASTAVTRVGEKHKDDRKAVQRLAALNAAK
jgi:hypothetical protein